MDDKKLFAKPSAIALTIGSILIRLWPHPPNFTPLGATALFGGAKLSRPWNYVLPLFILFTTDLVLGFHALMPYVYGCFALSVFLAEKYLKGSVTARKLTILATANSIIFFLVTNFGVWLQGHLYPHTIAGLTESYVMGLPFLRNMFAGDIVFTLGVFGFYALAQKQALLAIIDRRLTGWLIESGD